MMKTLSLIVALAAILGVQSFSSSSLATSRSSATQANAYIPSGFTAESYKKFKEQEKKKAANKNLGGLGPRGFKSRSFQSFQEALEKGDADHMMPMFNSKAKLKSGEIKMQDIPYMQRGGSWDNSDVKGAKKVKWQGSDKEYSGGGYKKEQSVSVWGYGEGLDWTGNRSKQGPEGEMRKAPKFAKNYKAPNVKTMKGVTPPSTEGKPKKFFGLF
jgi:hypothetical protein